MRNKEVKENGDENEDNDNVDNMDDCKVEEEVYFDHVGGRQCSRN